MVGAAVPPRGRDAAAVASTSRSIRNLGRSIITDAKRLQQVLKNLLSNAFKFTEQGGVRLHVSRRRSAAGAPDHPVLEPARRRWSRSRCPTPASASRRRSRRSSSRPSSRPTPAPAASTAAPASASPSAASWRACSAAKSSCAARRATAAPSRSTCRSSMSAPSDGAASGDAAQRRAGAARRARPERAVEQIPDDRLDIQPGDAVLLDRRGRSALCAHPARPRARQGLQGAGRDARRRRARACQAVPADRGLARRLPARHARLDRAQPAQAESADAAHPGADRHARRGSPARAGARRLLVRHQADDARRALPTR